MFVLESMHPHDMHTCIPCLHAYHVCMHMGHTLTHTVTHTVHTPCLGGPGSGVWCGCRDTGEVRWPGSSLHFSGEGPAAAWPAAPRAPARRTPPTARYLLTALRALWGGPHVSRAAKKVGARSQQRCRVNCTRGRPCKQRHCLPAKSSRLNAIRRWLITVK